MAPQKGAAMKGGLWKKIKKVALTDVTVLVKGVDRDSLDDIERVLAEADFGPTAFELVDQLEDEFRRGTLKTQNAVRDWLKSQIVGHLVGPENPGRLNLGDGSGPGVVLVLGVNGVGKTTQIAKLARRLLNGGKSVLLAAADTFRAGATEQISEWALRLDVPCITGTSGGDPAAVAFDAVEAATARGVDVVLIDTAGRLHTHDDLMEELKKIARVVTRKREGAPHESLLILDGIRDDLRLRLGREAF